jgi:hypothetical protein
MIWTLQSFLGQFFDAMVGQVVSVLGDGSRPTPWRPPQNSTPRRYTPHDSNTDTFSSPPLPAWEPARAAAAPAERNRERAAPLDQDLGGDATKLVSYTIVSLRRCHERILPGGSGEVLVTLSMTRETFAIWIVACYLQAEDCCEDDRAAMAQARRNEVPYDEKKYLRVSYEVLSRWPSEPKDCCEDGKLGALEEIRDALHDVSRRSTRAGEAPPASETAPPSAPPPAVAPRTEVGTSPVSGAGPVEPPVPLSPAPVLPPAVPPPPKEVQARKAIAKPAAKSTVPAPAPAPASAPRQRGPAKPETKPSEQRGAAKKPSPPPRPPRKLSGPPLRKPR